MGNGFVGWFNRSYKGIIVGLVAIMAIMLVILAMQHVNASKPAAGAEPRAIPTFGDSASTPRVAVIGDSYTACSGEGGCDSANYLVKLQRDLGWVFKPYAVGGTGYVNDGGGQSTFGQRVDKVIDDNPDVVIVEGGRNDVTQTEQLEVAAADVFKRLKAGLPDARIIVVGPIGTANSPDSELTARDKIKSAAKTAGISEFVDPIEDNWFSGADASLIGSDGVHPTDDGHVYMATKLEPVLRHAAG